MNIINNSQRNITGLPPCQLLHFPHEHYTRLKVFPSLRPRTCGRPRGHVGGRRRDGRVGEVGVDPDELAVRRRPLLLRHHPAGEGGRRALAALQGEGRAHRLALRAPDALERDFLRGREKDVIR